MEVLLVLLVPSVKTAETMLPPPPPVHWQLAWQDDFNGNVLNSSTWNVRNNVSVVFEIPARLSIAYLLLCVCVRARVCVRVRACACVRVCVCARALTASFYAAFFRNRTAAPRGNRLKN